MPRKRKSDYEPQLSPSAAPACYIAGCPQPGTYKAPKSRKELYEYVWLCLDHIREHNNQWDYFSGMNSEEIESFVRDSVTGHRPTWRRESHLRGTEQIEQSLHNFLNSDAKPIRRLPAVPAKVKKALLVFEVDYPYTLEQIKGRYRIMVKQHHPDLNKGNKQSEETFKQITNAYRVLTEHVKSTQPT